jgi:TonB family protein
MLILKPLLNMNFKHFLSTLLLLFPLLSFAQTPLEPDVSPNEFVLLEMEPVPLNLNELKRLIGYPRAAMEAEIEGKVIMRVLIDERGQYVKHLVIKDAHPYLTDAVTSKISAIRFTPGIQKGKAIKVWVTIPFDFKLLKDLTPPAKSGVFYSLKDALASPDPSSVVELYLNGKNLTAFPKEILKFPNLILLELGDNKLTRIPAEITSLTALRLLGLQMNRLNSLPADLWEMPSLKGVNLKNNAFSKSYQKSLLKDHAQKIFPKDDKGKVVW